MDYFDVDSAPRQLRDGPAHHPRVQRGGGESNGTIEGAWRWTCSCGNATCRNGELPSTWREAVIEALDHPGPLSA